MNQLSMIWVSEWTDLFVQSKMSQLADKLIVNKAGGYVLKSVIEDYHDFFKNIEGLMIPCLTGSIRELQVVESWLGEPFPYVISSNGAQIYRNGQLDEHWNQRMRKLITIEEVEADYQKIKAAGISSSNLEKVEDFYLKVDLTSLEEQSEWIVRLKRLFREEKRTIMPHGQSILVLPERLDKVHALDYLLQIEGLGENQLYTTGTQWVDQWFVMRGTQVLTSSTVFPGHPTAFKVTGFEQEEQRELLDFLMREAL